MESKKRSSDREDLSYQLVKQPDMESSLIVLISKQSKKLYQADLYYNVSPARIGVVGDSRSGDGCYTAKTLDDAVKQARALPYKNLYTYVLAVDKEAKKTFWWLLDRIDCKSVRE